MGVRKPDSVSRGEGEANNERSTLTRRPFRHDDDTRGEADGVAASKLSKGLLVMLGEFLRRKFDIT